MWPTATNDVTAAGMDGPQAPRETNRLGKPVTLPSSSGQRVAILGAERAFELIDLARLARARRPDARLADETGQVVIGVRERFQQVAVDGVAELRVDPKSSD